ncbi:MAG: hypothetical protein ACOZQL_43465 [Myxococcota bacterium]
MQRNTIVAFALMVLTALGLYVVLGTPLLRGDAPLKTECANFVGRPTTGWVTLYRCTLDMELLVLESEQGDFELLERRRQGLGKKPYARPPTWVRAWAPVRADGNGGVVRVAWRIESGDLLKWINVLERADERQKERLWADPTLLRRMSTPALLEGRAEKAEQAFVLDAFGTSASSSLLLLTAGKPPEQSLVGPVLAAAAIVMAAFVALRLLVRPQLTSAEGELTQVNVSDVKVELGELERLREEERRNR